jgi:hypothetical protein
MAITKRTISVLQELSKRTEPARPLEIAQALQMQPIHVGKELVELAKGGSAVKKDKDKNTWAITDEGTAYLKTLPTVVGVPETGASVGAPETGVLVGSPVTGAVVPLPVTSTTAPPPAPSPETTFPSQAEIFKREGELLAVGSRKGDIALDTIVKYVERMANLDDLDSVWNALTEMNVADNIKKRWLKLYAQDLPKHKMTEELKEKIESGQEEEKVRVEPKGDVVPPKPKRFCIINGEIIGDPEGDYSFNEALKALAQQQGAGPGQADMLATMIQAMQVGPQMSTTLITSLMPLLTKQPDTTMTSVLQQQIQALQTQIVTLTEERHKAEMESIRAEIRTGQKTPESDQQMQALNQRLDQLRDDLHKKDIEMITTQNTAIQTQLTNQITRLEQQIALVGQGKSTDSKIGLLGDIVNKGFGEVSGLRSDVKSMLPTILSRGQTVKRRTEAEKEHFSQGLDKGIERAKATKEAEEKLWPELKGS